MFIIGNTFENPFFLMPTYMKEKPANVRPVTEFMIHDVNPKFKAISCLPEFSPNIGSTRY